jgi:hypothetical protein
MHEIGDTPRFAFTDKATPKAMINRPDRNTTLRFSILFVLIGIKATDALVFDRKTTKYRLRCRCFVEKLHLELMHLSSGLQHIRLVVRLVSFWQLAWAR